MYVVPATDISELNIVARSLPEELQSLQLTEKQLSKSLAVVGEKVRERREAMEKETRSELADLRTHILQLKRELEVSVTSLLRPL